MVSPLQGTMMPRELFVTFDAEQDSIILQKRKSALYWKVCAVKKALPSCAAVKVLMPTSITAGRKSCFKPAKRVYRVTQSVKPPQARPSSYGVKLQP